MTQAQFRRGARAAAPRRRVLASVLAGPVVACWPAARAGAQTAAGAAYPNRTVRVIVPGGAGSGPDILARSLMSKLAELWGQPVLVENIVGAGGNIGHERAAKSVADGYTLLLGMIGPMAINPSLQAGKLGFDPVKDLAPITMVSRYPNILAVHPSVPAKNLQELLAYAKAHPGKLRYGTPGAGTTPHLSAVMMSTMAGVQLVEVPYKSSAQMTTDAMAGHIDMIFLNPGALLAHVKSGAMRGIAVTSTARQPYAPELPTMIESGLPGYEVSSWFGLFAPAGTPQEVIAKINADLLRVLAMPDIRQQYQARGDESFFGTPEQAGSYLRAEIDKWGRLIRDAKIKLE